MSICRWNGGKVTDANRAVAEKAHVLVVDDEESIRISLAEGLTDGETRVSTAVGGEEAMRILAQGEVDLVLLDQRLSQTGEDGLEVLARIKQAHPDVIVVMMTAFGQFSAAVEATRRGCYQYLAKPLDLHQLRLLIVNALSTVALSREVRRQRERQRRRFGADSIQAESPRMQQLLAGLEKVARSRTATVLIHGETGTGKELVARRVHLLSPLAGGPFVDLNCGAVPDTLLESEMFGHERGAFTDAKTAKEGLFELADGGTLFLDEIAEMPQKLQAKLLRVLETKTFRRVGGTRDVRVEVRILAATNRDLFAEVEAGRFREDLFYRLSVVPLNVPALRERREDIPGLIHVFLDHFNREMGRAVRGVTPAAQERLLAYGWPGNVRELKNTMEHLVLMCGGEWVDEEDLPDPVRRPRVSARGRAESGGLLRPGVVPSLEEVERAAIAHALAEVKGNRTRAAQLLGISRQTLRTKIERYSLEAGEEVARPEVGAG
jgi:two-component system, NtrC family, response regulator AtoC